MSVSGKGPVKALLFPVGEPARVIEIPEDTVRGGGYLAGMQLIVGGWIELAPLLHENGTYADLWCNENGKNLGLRLNRPLRDESGRCYDIVAGPCFIAPSEGGELVSISDEEITYWTEHLRPATYADFFEAMGGGVNENDFLRAMEVRS